MKVHQITEAGMLDGILAKAREIVNTNTGRTNTSGASASGNAQASGQQDINAALNSITAELFPRIDRAVQAGDRSTLTRTLSRSAQYVLSQLPNPDALTAHQQDRIEDAVFRQVIQRMADTAGLANHGGGNRDWTPIGRNDPRMFIEIVVDPTKIREYGL